MIILYAAVHSLYVGDDRTSLITTPTPTLHMDFSGIVGDKHAGYTRRADGRNKEYPRGTEIRNWRQWSAVSLEEVGQIAQELGVPQIEPSWLGSNLCLTGIANLSLLPKGSLLIFPENVVLVVEEENLPCIKPGRAIAAQVPQADIDPGSFVKASIHLRGIVGIVNRPGIVRLGDRVQVQIYQPKMYSFQG